MWDMFEIEEWKKVILKQWRRDQIKRLLYQISKIIIGLWICLKFILNWSNKRKIVEGEKKENQEEA